MSENRVVTRGGRRERKPTTRESRGVSTPPPRLARVDDVKNVSRCEMEKIDRTRRFFIGECLSIRAPSISIGSDQLAIFRKAR